MLQLPCSNFLRILSSDAPKCYQLYIIVNFELIVIKFNSNMKLVLTGELALWMLGSGFFPDRMTKTLKQMMDDADNFYWFAYQPMARMSRERQIERAYRNADASVMFVDSRISLKDFQAQVENFVTEIGTRAENPKAIKKIIVFLRFRYYDDDYASFLEARKENLEITDQYGITLLPNIDTFVEVMLSSKDNDKEEDLDLTPLKNPGVLEDKFRAEKEQKGTQHRNQSQKVESRPKSTWTSPFKAIARMLKQ